MNNSSHEEQLVNLCALLAENNPVCDDVFYLRPKMLQLYCSHFGDATQVHSINDDTIKVGEYYVTLITEANKNTWYIASCEKKNPDGTYEMEHLTRVQTESDLKWRHPVRIDKINLQEESIVAYAVNGVSNVSQERNMIFTLQNHVYI